MHQRRGRLPNRLTTLRRLEAHRLRRQGVSFPEIGRILGISQQAAWRLLQWNAPNREAPGYVVCRRCARVVCEDRRLTESNRAVVLCRGCLRDRPAAPLAVRLRSLRVSAELTCAELADRSGVSRGMIHTYEGGKHLPARTTLAKLAHVLGPALASPIKDGER
jgi:DNA-binding XRE family transcriptional regulator